MTDNRPCVLAVDIGTSSMKGGLISIDGELKGFARIPLADTGSGHFTDWDGHIWNRALKQLVPALAESGSQTYMGNISSVVISGNGPTLVPVDRECRLTGNVHLWADRREKRIPGEKSFFLPQAAWIRETDPDLYSRTEYFLGCPEYVSCLLTGTPSAFTTTPSFDPFIWTDDGIAAYGLDRNKFPQLIRIGSLLGKVSRKASEETGIPRGLPVFAGSSDFVMAVLGTAAVFPGRTCDRAGTSEGINYCTENKVKDERIRLLPHVIDGLYNAAGILSSTGAIFEWFRKISGQSSRDYEEMMGDILKVGLNTPIPGFFPSLHRGAVWEFSGALFVGLEADHGPSEMGRAVTNAIAFGVRDLIETLERNGCSIDSLRVSGGQGRSSIWNQMKADITGKSIEVPEVIDTELMGNACTGFTSGGFFTNLQESAEELVKIRRIHIPDDEEHKKYTDGYNSYHLRCAEIINMMNMEKGNDCL